MHANEELLRKFYTSFQSRDAAGMIDCYHPEIMFSDPMFPDLQGGRARAMWLMLCERGVDLQIEYEVLQADDSYGEVAWEAHYTFSKTGKKVHNKIRSQFDINAGQIIRQIDSFSLYRWMSMAFGLKGKLTGFLPAVQRKVRDEAARGLDLYIKRKRLKV